MNTMNSIFPARLALAAAVLILSLALLVGSLWPAETTLQALRVPEQLQGIPQAAVEFKQVRILNVEWPRWIRAGDAARVRLQVTVDPQQPAPDPGGLKDIFTVYNLVLESRLDLAGMDVEPEGAVSETLQPESEVELIWSVRPPKEGMYRGNLWVYLNLVPRKGGETQRQTVASIPLDIEARTVLGLPAWVARWGSIAGTVLGLVLGAPFLQDLIKRLWGRRKNKLDKLSLQ